MQQTEYKKELKEKCISFITERMDNLRVAMEQAQTSANEETKSSAGDKYETSRAMGHLAKDMYARQLAETGKELASLLSIDCSVKKSSVQPGCIVRSGDMSYFILAGIGKITYDGEIIYVISPNAPVAKLLIGKKTGETVTINKRELQIIEIL
jgi:Transcription elongation factor, GreA/GreB, C-term